jgi:hypothetical protein
MHTTITAPLLQTFTLNLFKTLHAQINIAIIILLIYINYNKHSNLKIFLEIISAIYLLKYLPSASVAI